MKIDIEKQIFKTLSQDELAEHAFNVFLYQGRHPMGARLIYETLQRNPYHSLGLRCLADILNQEGLEVFSAVTLEYSLVHAEMAHEEESHAYDEMLFYSKYAWGFSEHSSGKVNLQVSDLKDKSAFTIDHDRYQDFVNQVIQRAGGLEKSFETALRVCGIMAHFLEHKERKKTSDFKELFDKDKFILTDQYNTWLNSYEPKLEELMRRRFLDGLNQISI